MMLRSSLARHQPRTPPDERELHALAAWACHEQGIVCLCPDQMRGDFARQALINEANRLYGTRQG